MISWRIRSLLLWLLFAPAPDTITSGDMVSTHWGRVMHICVGKLTIIGSDNGLSPGRRQAIIWTRAKILLIGPLGTNFSEILIGTETFSLKKMHLKMASVLSRLQCVNYAKWVPVFHEERLFLPALSQFWELVADANIIFMFPNINSARVKLFPWGLTLRNSK